MPQPLNVTPDGILKFWFDAGPQKWWVKDKDFDLEIKTQFGSTHEAACQGLLDQWTASAGGALALTIVLDQFSRNLFRRDPRAFAQDEQARRIAKQAICKSFDQEFPVNERVFFYLPFMHAEDLTMQTYCTALYQTVGEEKNVVHAREHADIIRRFGRFPHRNKVLGRTSSPAEVAFLSAGGFSG